MLPVTAMILYIQVSAENPLLPVTDCCFIITASYCVITAQLLHRLLHRFYTLLQVYEVITACCYVVMGVLLPVTT